jgi:hypothetical protein
MLICVILVVLRKYITMKQSVYTFIHLALNIPSGVPPGPQTVIFCVPVVTITTDVLLIFVCVRHQLKINIR